MYLNFVSLREESFILGAFISVVYSRFYPRDLLFSYPELFSYSSLWWGNRFTLPCTSARYVSLQVYSTRIISYHLPARREEYEALGAEDCCHGYRAYTEVSTDKLLRWDIVLIRRRSSVYYCSRCNSVIVLLRDILCM